ncbi:MAG TPA: hypothetical protein VJB16_03145, partial [archaeon]|nr:hypothetical protein [archaeon]
MTVNNALIPAQAALDEGQGTEAAHKAFLVALEPPVRRFLSAWLFERPMGERTAALQLLGRLLWIPKPTLQRLQPLVGVGASAVPGAAEGGTIVTGTWLPLVEFLRAAWHSVSWLRQVARRAGWALSDLVFELRLLPTAPRSKPLEPREWGQVIRTSSLAADADPRQDMPELERRWQWLLEELPRVSLVTHRRLWRMRALPTPRRLLAFDGFLVRSGFPENPELEREFRSLFWGIEDLQADVEQALDAAWEAQFMRTILPHEAFMTALSDPARELIQGVVDVPAGERAFWLTVLVDTFELDDVAEPLRNLLLPMPAGRLTSPKNAAQDHREPPRGDVIGMELVPL